MELRQKGYSVAEQGLSGRLNCQFRLSLLEIWTTMDSTEKDFPQGNKLISLSLSFASLHFCLYHVSVSSSLCFLVFLTYLSFVLFYFPPNLFMPSLCLLTLTFFINSVYSMCDPFTSSFYLSRCLSSLFMSMSSTTNI